MNVFGDKVLSREEVYRLFNLFKQNHILGIFTLEKNDSGDPEIDNFVSSTKYMADVVISLIKSEYNHYIQTYLEVEKSRNVPQVYGKHPYKIRDVKEASKTIRKKLVVYPSLHYIVYGTEKKKQAHEGNNDKTNLFGIEAFSDILPEYFQTSDNTIADNLSSHNNAPTVSRIVSITGEPGMFKSDLAINAVLYGLANHEDGLIIHLSDRTLFCENGVRFNREVYMALRKNTEKRDILPQLEQDYMVIDEGIDEEHKFVLSSWTYPDTGARLIEIVFKSGALLPEEFIDIVCRIINTKDCLQKKSSKKNTGIKNIAFIDLKAIGICYPFLIDSETSGDMFIPAFTHIMRNYGINVFFSSSFSGIKKSDDVVRKAVGLSDAVVRCEKKQENKQSVFINSSMTVIKNKTVTVSLCEEKGEQRKKGFNIYKDKKIIRQMPQLQMFCLEVEQNNEKKIEE